MVLSSCGDGEPPVVVPTIDPSAGSSIEAERAAKLIELQSKAAQVYQQASGQASFNLDLEGDLVINDWYVLTSDGQILQSGVVLGKITALSLDKELSKNEGIIFVATAPIPPEQQAGYQAFLRDPAIYSPLIMEAEGVATRFISFTAPTQGSPEPSTPLNVLTKLPEKHVPFSIADLFSDYKPEDERRAHQIIQPSDHSLSFLREGTPITDLEQVYERNELIPYAFAKDTIIDLGSPTNRSRLEEHLEAA